MLDHRRKIKQLVIGTDFCQTNPSILRALMPLKAARVGGSQSGAPFHPKVYAFVDASRVAALVGSSNFTQGGTVRNEEACLLLEGTADEPPLRQILQSVDAWWHLAPRIDPDFLDAYERQYEATRAYRRALTKKPLVPKPRPGALHRNLLSMSWAKYVQAVDDSGKDRVARRLDVLRRSRIILAEVDSFADVDAVERKAIAGFVGSAERDAANRLKGLDWAWFGSMRGAGTFKNRVADARNSSRAHPRLAGAVDSIPGMGVVDEAHYTAFADLFRTAFEGSERAGQIASASRLLAMKRPDCFVCVDSANRKSLGKDIGFAPTTLNLDNYWERVIAPVMSATWWNAKRPGGREGRIWDGRAAMLDAIYYEPL
ncbi:phospholipase D family protein [Ramlibacter sp.]|uniref:phospholipase D family protein n=1 Tax=Ramlibacter sp. TaxID=1917967 RepID=UPI0018406585|nr:phospholipase D family protein [Ramlibacter sp.]MBA2672336.1 hypothetical protein [Ramlibacter sp.]